MCGDCRRWWARRGTAQPPPPPPPRPPTLTLPRPTPTPTPTPRPQSQSHGTLCASASARRSDTTLRNREKVEWKMVFTPFGSFWVGGFSMLSVIFCGGCFSMLSVIWASYFFLTLVYVFDSVEWTAGTYEWSSEILFYNTEYVYVVLTWDSQHNGHFILCICILAGLHKVLAVTVSEVSARDGGGGCHFQIVLSVICAGSGAQFLVVCLRQRQSSNRRGGPAWGALSASPSPLSLTMTVCRSFKGPCVGDVLPCPSFHLAGPFTFIFCFLLLIPSLLFHCLRFG